jgi:predicted nucleic acid-binding protein
MAWVVDTCLLLDIGLDDPQFAEKTELLLAGRSGEGLVICPVTFVELAPAFSGNTKPLEEFLFSLGIEYREDWIWQDTTTANAAWSHYVEKRRARQTAKRPVADVLIGAFACRFQGLLTRNAGDFSKIFPQLPIAQP